MFKVVNTQVPLSAVLRRNATSRTLMLLVIEPLMFYIQYYEHFRELVTNGNSKYWILLFLDPIPIFTE